MHLDTYLDQHKGIKEEILQLTALARGGVSEENAAEIAKHINVLAGKLNTHLSIEDKYLYPELKARDDQEALRVVNEYVSEMADLAAVFNEYKLTFNTRTKLIQNKVTFKKQTETIMTKITERMTKEENGIYRLI